MSISLRPVLLVAALLLTTAMAAAHAGLVIRGSRVIYDENQGETTVHMRYTGEVPVLLQVWLDQGDAEQPAGAEDIPFILTPAVTRMDPGNAQSVRILRVAGGLPQDRESLFWFNTLEVPPAPSDEALANENFIRFSVRGRFKFFYRPKGLSSSPKLAAGGLRFSMAPPLPDGRAQIRVVNPSPYHVTLSRLEVRQPGDSVSARALLEFQHQSNLERMVPPMGELLMPLEWSGLPSGAALPSALQVDYHTINDSGGLEPGQQRMG